MLYAQPRISPKNKARKIIYTHEGELNVNSEK